MTQIVLPDCPPPYFALAHSMGANILLRAACHRDCWFDRMVLDGADVAACEFEVVGINVGRDR